MPDEPTLQQFLDRLGSRGDRPAIIAYTASGHREVVSFAELSERIDRLAHGLAGCGLRPGEAVVVAGANSPSWIAVALAAVRAGGVVAPVNATLSQESLRKILSLADSRWIFADSVQIDALRAAGAHADIFALDTTEGTSNGALPWGRLFERPAAPLPSRTTSDEAALFFTSGTTGLPKGVPLTHRNLRANLDALLAHDLATPGDRVLVPLPFFHIYPFMVGMLLPLSTGAAVVLPSAMTGPAIVHALRDAGATAVIGVPKLLDTFFKGIRQRVAGAGKTARWLFDTLLRASIWSHRKGVPIGRAIFALLRRAFARDLRLLASGGARLDPDTAWALNGLGWEVLTGYGLTETSPIVSFSRRGRRQMATAGKPLDDVEVRLDKPDSEGFGEIWVRGPNVFHGYRGQPEATREVLTPDGWFRTRDLGRFDAEGCLDVAARTDDTIVLPGGKKIFPEEVETALEQSPLIHKAAVVSSDGRLVAIVVPNAEAVRQAEGDPAAAVRAEAARIARTLPEYQRPTEILLTRRDLPQTLLGKLQRFKLPPVAELRRQQEPVTSSGTVSAVDQDLLESEPARRLWDWLQRTFPDRGLTLDSDPRSDLGIDSLDRMTLALDLERDLGIHLREEAFSEANTIRKLLEEAVALEQRRASATSEQSGPLTAQQQRWLSPPTLPVRWLGYVLFGLAKLIMRLVFRLDVRGLQTLPPGPLIVTPNHVSYLDPVAIAAALPFPRLSETYWGGFRGLLFASAPRRLFSRATRILPIDPEHSPASSLALAEAVLAGNGTLVWFPEGARSIDGTLRPFMPGIGRVLARQDAKVLPVVIHGTYEAWPVQRRWPRAATVRVRFGTPVSAAELRREAGSDAPEAIAAALRERVASLATQDN